MAEPTLALAPAIAAYLQALAAQGKHPRTLYTYGKDCEQILAYFGPEKRLSNILPAHIARFFKSDELLKVSKTGKDRAPATILKTQRVLRMLLIWAVEQGWISTLPWPKGANKEPSAPKTGQLVESSHFVPSEAS